MLSFLSLMSSLFLNRLSVRLRMIVEYYHHPPVLGMTWWLHKEVIRTTSDYKIRLGLLPGSFPAIPTGRLLILDFPRTFENGCKEEHDPRSKHINTMGPNWTFMFLLLLIGFPFVAKSYSLCLDIVSERFKNFCGTPGHSVDRWNLRCGSWKSSRIIPRSRMKTGLSQKKR